MWRRAETHYREEVRHGNPATDPATLFLTAEEVAERIARHPRLSFVEEHVGDPVFQAHRPPPVRRNMRRLRFFLRDAAGEGAETFILCDNDGQAERLDDLLSDRGGTPPPGCHLVVGSLTPRLPHRRFRSGRQRPHRSRDLPPQPKLRRGRRFRGSASLESLAQL